MTIFHYDVDADGVATITWDDPNQRMNVLTMEGVYELDAAFDKAIADDAVKGIILTSGKADFAGGMDLNVLAQMKDSAGEDPARGLFEGITAFHARLRKMELAGADPKTKKGGKPVIWAAPGTAVGIGLELGLACQHRIAADNPGAKIGLPEIKVGIFPGAGGTTRLIHMLGIMGASPFLLEGKLVDPKKAKSAGLIDAVVAPGDLLNAAKEWVLNATRDDIIKPWDKKGFKLPGGAAYTPQGFQTFVGANAMVAGKTQGVYPAAKALLSAAYEMTIVDFDTALRIEARWFTNVLMNPSSAAMIRSLFLNKEALEKGAVRPEGIPDQRVKKLGVLGAGMMGAGIAYVSAMAGIEVVLIDRDQAAADKGKAHAAGILDEGIKRRKTTPAQKDAVLARITATPDYAALSDCDLVIEAVFEDPKVKAEVTAQAEAHLPKDAIFATNTSTLPVSGLAKASRAADQFIGIHFFSPVHKMMLVEIIKGKETGDRAVAKALDYVRQIRKTPIVVNDARFFYANRCIIPYINEGVRMVAEGIKPALIENAAKQMGMPVGPLQLADEIAIDLSVKIAKATKDAMGDAYDDTADPVWFGLFEMGRLGRKSKSGFYAYSEKGKRTGLWEGLAEHWPLNTTQPGVEEVKNRLAMIQTLEAVRALEENVLLDVREGDVGAILGWGFMPWSGGPLSWLDILGADHAAAICDDLTTRHGARFTTPALLKDLAQSGETFYQRFAA